MIWWEDFKAGDRAELGRHAFTEEEIVAFGRQYDPQPMVEGYIGKTASLGSPGMENSRWLKPVEGWGLFGRKN